MSNNSLVMTYKGMFESRHPEKVINVGYIEKLLKSKSNTMTMDEIDALLLKNSRPKEEISIIENYVKKGGRRKSRTHKRTLRKHKRTLRKHKRRTHKRAHRRTHKR